MYHVSRRLRFLLLTFVMLLIGCSACSPTTNTITSTPTLVPAYTIAGGGDCVKLGQHVQAPFTNVRVSHDTYLAHSEPMLAENPKNPLNLVGGSKFFTDPTHYKFQTGFFSSFDGGCTWTDGGVLPGFEKNEMTSDISFAFGNHNDVYAAVLYDEGGLQGKSGIAVSKSTDGGKTFGNPVSVFELDPIVGISTLCGPMIIKALAEVSITAVKNWHSRARPMGARLSHISAWLREMRLSARTRRLVALLAQRSVMQCKGQYLL